MSRTMFNLYVDSRLLSPPLARSQSSSSFNVPLVFVAFVSILVSLISFLLPTLSLDITKLVGDVIKEMSYLFISLLVPPHTENQRLGTGTKCKLSATAPSGGARFPVTSFFARVSRAEVQHVSHKSQVLAALAVCLSCYFDCLNSKHQHRERGGMRQVQHPTKV